MESKNIKELKSQSTEIALSAIGTLVGLAIGGPVGAIAGGVVPPVTKLAITAGTLWYDRRKKRLVNVVNRAFAQSGKTESEIFQEMIDSPEWCDTIISMIRQLADNDPELDMLFSQIMASAISAQEERERNRFIVLHNAIRGMNKVQLLILKHMYLCDGVLSAENMADKVKVPELELRNAVRDLELRGMIVDNGSEPTIWAIRELGTAIAKTIFFVEKMEE